VTRNFVRLGPGEIMHPQAAPAAPLAETNMATGLVRCFFDLQGYQRLMGRFRSESDLDGIQIDSLSDDDLETLSAILHEREHVFQLSFSGYGYDLSLRMLKATMEAGNTVPNLDKLLRQRERFVQPLQDLWNSVWETGADGVSAEMILEGSAFMAEIATDTSWASENMSAANLAENFWRFANIGHVADWSVDVYTAAFTMAYNVLAERAHIFFRHIANLCLYTARPGEVFVPLLHQFARWGSVTDKAYNQQMALSFLAEKFGSQLLGTAYFLRMRPPAHLALLGSVDVVSRYMASSARVADELGSNGFYSGPLNCMMVFAPDAKGEVPVIWEGLVQDDYQDAEHEKGSFRRWVTAVNILLYGAVQRPPRSQSQLEPLDIPRGDSAVPPGRLMMGNAPTLRVWLDNFVGSREHVEDRLREARRWRGHLVLDLQSIAAASDEASLWNDLRDLRRLWTDMPHLLYFLDETTVPLLQIMASSVATRLWQADLRSARSLSPYVALLSHQDYVLGAEALAAASRFAEKVGEAGSVPLLHLARLEQPVRLNLARVLQRRFPQLHAMI
jgi:hypothetical protein